MEFLSYEQGIGLYLNFTGNEEATPFHTVSWLRFLAATLPGARIRFLFWDQDGYPIGVMPVVERVRFGIKAAYSVPFDAPGGPLGAPLPHGWESYFSGYLHARVVDNRGDMNCSWPFETRTAFIVNLNNPTVSRSQIKARRQAARRGLEVHEINALNGELFQLYKRVKRQRGGLTYSRSTLERMIQEMQGHIIGFSAVFQEKPIAFILNFKHNQNAIAYLHGFDRNYAHTRPMSALITQSIDRLREEGCSSYSLGTTDTRDTGQVRFKQSFGAKPREIRIFVKGRGLGKISARIRAGLWRRRGI